MKIIRIFILHCKYFLPIALVLFFSSCTRRQDKGSEKNPFIFSLVPGQDIKILSQEGEKLEAWLFKDLGIHVKVMVPSNFIAVVESLGSKRTDIAIMNTFGYVLAHEKYQAQARLIGLNGNYDHYWGQIIARKDRVKSLKDLNGKKFAFVDPASTSGYILAKKLFAERGIKLRDFVFAGRHDSVASMVYQGQVDAGATYHSPAENGAPQDARKLVLTQYPDVFDKVQILEKTGPIPNDPVVFRADFPTDLREKIAESLKRFIKTDEGQTCMRALYHMSDLRDVTDQHYDSAREVLKKLGQSAQDLVK